LDEENFDEKINIKNKINEYYLEKRKGDVEDCGECEEREIIQNSKVEIQKMGGGRKCKMQK
jgi:hypothetical protein